MVTTEVTSLAATGDEPEQGFRRRPGWFRRLRGLPLVAAIVITALTGFLSAVDVLKQQSTANVTHPLDQALNLANAYLATEAGVLKSSPGRALAVPRHRCVVRQDLGGVRYCVYGTVRKVAEEYGALGPCDGAVFVPHALKGEAYLAEVTVSWSGASPGGPLHVASELLPGIVGCPRSDQRTP